MKIDFAQNVPSIEGGSITDENNKPITLGSLCKRAFLTMIEGDEKQTPEDKYAAYKVAQKIEENQEVTTEEVVKIKERVGKVYSPVIMGPVWDILEA